MEPLDERHLCPERGPRLCELDADDAPTEDDEALGRHLRGRRLPVSPGTRLLQPGDRRHHRAAPGRHHDRLPGDERVVADADALLAVDPAASAHERDASLLEPRQLHRVVEVVDDFVAPREHRGNVDALPLGGPGTRPTSAIRSPGRSSALDGMHA